MKRSSMGWFVATVALLAGLASSAVPQEAAPRNAQSLFSVLWVQTAGEYTAGAEQAYIAAEAQLDRALADSRWCADLAQIEADDYAGKRPAVILDVDETVLDNTPFNARLARDYIDGKIPSEDFNGDLWSSWTKKKTAAAIPGAVRFIRHAQARGCRVYFVTNRDEGSREDTLANLLAVGIRTGLYAVLTRGAEGEKAARRAMVAANHRIVLLVGDDLGDFLEGARKMTAEARLDAVRSLPHMVGTRWIFVPNPIYGGWRDSLGKDLPAKLRSFQDS